MERVDCLSPGGEVHPAQVNRPGAPVTRKGSACSSEDRKDGRKQGGTAE